MGSGEGVMLTHVDLFSGIGGFSLACEWAGVETIAFAETDSYASKVLRKHWPSVRNYGDVCAFPKLSAWLLTAGVPCQPTSVAGKRRGTADDRWLWPQTLAVVENGSYEWLLFENPTGILSLNDGVEFERICSSLEGQGYEVQPLVIPACAVGAPHRRDRVWILAHARYVCGRNGAKSSQSTSTALTGLCETVAYTESARLERLSITRSIDPCGTWTKRADQSSASRGNVADTSINGLEEGRWDTRAEQGRPNGNGWWSFEPNVGRVANGIPKRVDRLRCLGNAIVPEVAFRLISAMIETERIKEREFYMETIIDTDNQKPFADKPFVVSERVYVYGPVNDYGRIAAIDANSGVLTIDGLKSGETVTASQDSVRHLYHGHIEK